MLLTSPSVDYPVQCSRTMCLDGLTRLLLSENHNSLLHILPFREVVVSGYCEINYDTPNQGDPATPRAHLGH